MADIRRKILLAVDGSDQALEAVRYISAIVPPDGTEIVLFSVGTGFPEVYWDMNLNPLYRSKKDSVKGWLASNQLVMGEFKEKAFKILSDAGYPKEAISAKTPTQKTNVIKDIVQESYQDYHALVMGRTGISRLKDLMMGSMAYKLIEKIKHIPTIVVGGKPSSEKILIALDDSIEAMRATNYIGKFAGARDLEVTICHVLSPPAMSPISGSRSKKSGEDDAWQEYNKNRFRPCMEEAVTRLVKAGMKEDRISTEFLFYRGRTIQKIIDTALEGGYGTIVVGRREAIGFAESTLRGRFSDKLISATHNVAVWVVS